MRVRRRVTRQLGTALIAALGLWCVLTPGASAQTFRNRVAAEPGGTLEVRLSSGSIEIETHDEREVSVDAEARGISGGSMQFELSGDGRDTRLVGNRSGWLSVFGSGFVQVRVRVPEEYSVDVRTAGGSIEISDLGGWVQARTSGGSVDVDGALGDVELRTSGGSIRVEDVEGNVTAVTSGGSVRIDEVTGSVEANTSGGPVQVHEVGGPVQARTSGGSISVRFNERAEGQLRTSGGSIEVEFSEDTGVDLKAETSGGRVEVEDELRTLGSIERSRIEGEINGGGPELQLRTSGGNIRVRAR
jgi:ferric-dicitrate binding protein FerR (iron transport regulator)